MKMNSPDGRKLPPDIQSVRRANLQRQPWYRARAIRRIAGQSLIRVSANALNQCAAFRGGVARAPFDPPGIHRLIRWELQQWLSTRLS